MKVLHLTGMRSTKFGSLEKWYLVLAEELAGYGATLSLHYNERPRSDAYRQALEERGVDLLVSRPPASRVAQIAFYARLIRRQKPRIVHAQFNSKAVYAAKLLRAPQIYWTIALEVSRYGCFNKMLVRLLLSRISQCFGASEQVVKQMRRNGFDRSRSSVLYYGLSFGYMTSGRLPAQPPNEVIFCVVANCARVKGIDVFLRAFKRILENYPQCSCVQVGIDVNKNPQYKVLARELGVAHKVQWVGITDHAYDHIRACDIFVQPSRREAFGFTLLEAMYAGKPIVATRVGGIPEAVADGVNGRLVASDDHVELAEACISLIGNPSERERLGANGRARVVEKFDSRVMIRKLLREYYGLRHPQIAERDRAL